MPQIGDRIKVFSLPGESFATVVGSYTDKLSGEKVWKVQTPQAWSRRILTLSEAHVVRHTIPTSNAASPCALAEAWG